MAQGGQLSVNSAEVRFEGIHTLSDSVVVVADEDETGYAGNWFIGASALRVAPARSASSSLSAASRTRIPQSVTAACPGAKRLLGVGGRVQNGQQQVLDDLRPNAGLTSVTVTGFEDETGYQSDWYVEATAICATPLPGLERVTAESATPSGSALVQMTCPTGKHLTGAGGSLNGALGQVALNSIMPTSGLRDALATGYVDETGFGGDWSLRGFSICVNY